jgi:hypothetical protein
MLVECGGGIKLYFRKAKAYDEVWFLLYTLYYLVGNS